MDRLILKRGTLLSLGMKAKGIKGVYRNESVFPSIRIEIGRKQKTPKANFEIFIVLKALQFRGIFHFPYEELLLKI